MVNDQYIAITHNTGNMLEICCWSIYGILPAIKKWRINGDLREINSYLIVTYWTYREAHPSMDV
jgi:hypothetical protein